MPSSDAPARAGPPAAANAPLLHRCFHRAAAARPDGVAIDVPPGRGRPDRRLITFAELAARARAVAARLAPSVRPDDIVAVLLPRTSLDAYAAPLGILEAGAAWAPIERAFPDARILEILDDSRAVAVVTDEAGAARLAGRSIGRAEIVVADAVGADAAASPPPLTPASLAYVIHTSGTSGRPKGVMIEHAAIANLVAGDLDAFRLAPEDRVGQSSSHAYDSSIEEMWLAFAAGATLVVLDDDTVRSGPDLPAWLERERITVLCPSPTQLRTMACRSLAATPPRLRLLYVGGEPLPQDLADVWAPGRRMENGYGPTECAVTALRGPVVAGRAITIGRPVPGVRAWALDGDLEPVAAGEPGELCLGGAGLARGYLHDPDATAAVFVDHPRLGRIYRTGDRARVDESGAFLHEGRLDTQVKIRGYRIELEEVEARLAALAGVRSAGCRVQGDASRAVLAAFVVPDDSAAPPDPAALRAALAAVLPAHIVPATIRLIDALPVNAGGKLDRAALPGTPPTDRPDAAPADLPASTVAGRIAHAMDRVLRRGIATGADEDFFHDLGGDSLAAAQLVSILRDDPATSAATVRDVYEAPTVSRLAERLGGRQTASAAPAARARPAARPFRAAVVQTAWLALELAVAAAVAAWLLFVLVPPVLLGVGLVPSLLLAPVAAAVALPLWALATTAVAAAAKRLLIGTYAAGRAPAWSSFYIRNWIVQRVAARIPWRLLEGTVFEAAVLRALGARIGRRVHLHRGVNLRGGGWDLLEIGDDAAVGQDASLRVAELTGGELVLAPVHLGAGATVGARAGVAGGASMGAGASLTPLSSLATGARVPDGERWDGVPAMPAGRTPEPPRVPAGPVWTPVAHGAATVAARLLSALAIVAPIEAVALGLALAFDADADALLAWVAAPAWNPATLGALAALGLLPLPLTLSLQALVLRGLGRIRPGAISRWSPTYVRVWIKTDLVRSAGDWLSGTLFWPWWLRAAGMRIGRGSEISTIIDVVPEHVRLGQECFLADGVYLGGPVVSRGTVTLAATEVGSNVFVGNHAVIPAGRGVPDGVLIGVSTVADDRLRRGTSWFGHPPFELPRRPLTGWDRRLTHDPTPIRYLTRLVWESARALVPPALIAVEVGWLLALGTAFARGSALVAVAVVAPLATAAALAALAGGVLGLKWVLLGRVRPGEHPLWSCWCSRWDFLYVAWARLARPALAPLEGTPLLAGYLRAMGAGIGRGVVLGPGFAQVVDPDMLHLEDGATVHALFQAHTFEDRVLKIDHVWIRRGATVEPGAVVFYGADVGPDAWVGPHSVVMKRERLPGGGRYEGCPTRPV